MLSFLMTDIHCFVEVHIKYIMTNFLFYGIWLVSLNKNIDL